MPHDHHDPDHPHSLLPPDPALRVRALETILTQKGLIDPAALDEIIDTYQNRIGPQNGAAVIARAWSDPEFKQRLLRDGSATVAYIPRKNVVGLSKINRLVRFFAQAKKCTPAPARRKAE